MTRYQDECYHRIQAIAYKDQMTLEEADVEENGWRRVIGIGRKQNFAQRLVSP